MKDLKNCDGRIFGLVHSRGCSRKGQYEHEGKVYCKTHHPPEIKRKDAIKQKAWEEKWAERDTHLIRNTVCLTYCIDLSTKELQKRIDLKNLAK